MTQPINPEINRSRTGLFSRVAVIAGAGALVVGACGRGDSDNDALVAPSVAEQIVVGLDDIDAGYCADTFGTEEFTYGLDDEGNVVEAGEEADRIVERTYVPQTVGALLPFDPEKANEEPSAYRLYSDGVQAQLEGETLDQVTTDVIYKICKDPLYSEHLIAGFGNITGTSGLPLRESNAWMSKSVDVADDIAESQFWNFDNLDLTSQERQTLSNAEIVKRMNTHETRAALLIELMQTYFTSVSFAKDTMTSYHIALADPEVNEDNGLLPELTDENPNYKGNFIVFQYLNKDGRCIEVGLNLGDGRFSELVDGVCIQEGDITTTSVMNPVTTTTEVHITTTTNPNVSTTSTTQPEEETTEEETTTTIEETTTTIEETTTTDGDKEPTGSNPRGGEGSGGDPEHGDDPENDSDDDGYGPGDREFVDPDGDGIHNVIDQCPDKAETWNGYQDDDGCPDVAPAEEPADDVTATTGVAVTSTNPPAPATTNAPIGTEEDPTQGTVAALPGFGN